MWVEVIEVNGLKKQVLQYVLWWAVGRKHSEDVGTVKAAFQEKAQPNAPTVSSCLYIATVSRKYLSPSLSSFLIFFLGTTKSWHVVAVDWPPPQPDPILVFHSIRARGYTRML